MPGNQAVWARLVGLRWGAPVPGYHLGCWVHLLGLRCGRRGAAVVVLWGGRRAFGAASARQEPSACACRLACPDGQGLQGDRELLGQLGLQGLRYRGESACRQAPRELGQDGPQFQADRDGLVLARQRAEGWQDADLAVPYLPVEPGGCL